MSEHRITLKLITDNAQAGPALDETTKKVKNVGVAAEESAKKTSVAAAAVEKAFGAQGKAATEAATRTAQAQQSATRTATQYASATTGALNAVARAQKAQGESELQAASRIKAMVAASAEKQRALYAEVQASSRAADAARASAAATLAEGAARKSAAASVDTLRASADSYLAQIRVVQAAQLNESKTLGDITEKRKLYAAALANGTLLENEHREALVGLESAEKRIQKEMAGQAAALQSLMNKYDPASAQLKRITEDERRLTSARDAGTLSQEKYTRAMAGLTVQRARWQTEAEGIGRVSQALGRLKLGSNEALASYGALVGMVSRGDWNALGQSALGASGRLGILKFAFTGLGAVVLAVIAVLGSFAVGMTMGYLETTKLNTAIIATGNYANTTAAELQDMGESIGDVTGRYGPARNAVEGLVASGKVAGAVLKDASAAAVDYARVTGRSIEEAIAVMVKISEDPVAAARELDKQYHVLSASTYAQIRALNEEGRTVEATALAYQVLADEFADRREQVEENLGFIERAWKSLGDTASATWDAMLGLGREDSLESKIQEQIAQIQRAERDLADLQSGGTGGGYAIGFIESLFGDSPEEKFAQLTAGLTTARVKLAELQQQQTGSAQSTSLLDERIKQGVDSLDKYSASALANVDVAKQTKAAALEAAIAREIERRSVGLSADAQEELARAIMQGAQASIDKAQMIDAEVAAEKARQKATVDAAKALRTRDKDLKEAADRQRDYAEMVHRSAEEERDWLAKRAEQQAQFDLQAKDLQNEITLLGTYGEARARMMSGLQAESMARDNNGNMIEKERKRLEALLETYRKAKELDAIVLEFDLSGFDELIEKIEKMQEALENVGDKGPEYVAQVSESIGNARQEALMFAVDAVGQGISSLQSMATEGTSAYKKLETAQLALNVVTAIGAIVNQGKGDPYTAFARMAAMAAAVAALVGNLTFSGGGPSSQSAEVRQETQGTGTVLGDAEAKSESILNAMEITADATSELVGINRGMLRALQTLESGIGSASGMLARGAGDVDVGPLATGTGGFLGGLPDPLGLTSRIFGGSQELIDQGIVIAGGALNDMLNNIVVGAYNTIQTDGGWFSGDDVDTNVTDVTDQLGAQFQLIIASITETVRQGALALGMLPDEIEDALARFQIEEIRISLQGLSAEEQQAELQAVFSSIFDGLAGSVVPYIEQFQQLGEGLGETLVRVATSVQVTQEAMGQLGFTLGDLDPETLAQVSVGLVDLMGGVDQFIQGMSTFVDRFASDEHKFDIAQDALTRAFAEAGLTIPATRDAMWELMQSLDATTEEGREHIALLLRLAGVSDEYYDFIEDRAETAAEQAQAQADAAQAEAEATAAALEQAAERARGFREELDGIFAQSAEIARPRGNQLDEAVLAINRQFDDLIRRARELEISLGIVDPMLSNLNQLELDRVAAIEAATAAIYDNVNTMLDGLEFDLSLGEMTEQEAAIARVNRQYDGYRQQIIDTTNDVDQLARVERLRAIAIEQLNTVQEQAAEYATSLRDALAILGDSIREMLEKFTGAGMRSLVEQATGLSPVENAGPTRVEALADIGSQYGTQVLTLTQQLTAAQEALRRASPYNTPERTTLEAKIRLLQDALSQVNGAMGDALEYAAELYQQQVDAMLGDLAGEFGSQDPIDIINERFDGLIEQAERWGATTEELEQIEAYRLIALNRAIEERYASEEEWLRRLVAFRDSLITDQNLTTLTPEQRLAELASQYQNALTAAESGDPIARNNFENIARQYAEALRGFYGSTDSYTSAFQGILADLDNLIEAAGINATPPETAEATVTTLSADPQTIQTVQLGMQSTKDEITLLRSDLTSGNVQIVLGLNAIKNEVIALKTQTQLNTAAIKAANDRNNKQRA